MRISAFGIKLIFFFWKNHDKKIHRDWPSKEDYKIRKDVDALGDGRHDHQFDIVYAKPEKRLGRTLIDIHGGAYVYSYRENNFGYASVFADAGYDVVLLDYPHSNKKQGTDEQVRVLGKQLAYLKEHAAELGLGGNEFGLIGDSAGGHFALLLAEASCDGNLQEKLGIDLKGLSFVGVAVSSPVYDFVGACGVDALTPSGKKLMFGPKYGDHAFAELYSPKTHIDSLTIPLFVNGCRHDFIGEQTMILRQELEEKGRPFTYCYIDSPDKTVDHVHNVTKISLPESRQVNESILAFFDPLFQKK